MNKQLAKQLTLLDDTRLRTLEAAINDTAHLPGEIIECGSYNGGSALFMKCHMQEINSNKILRLFDSFEGIPNKTEYDIHEIGDIKGDSYDTVKELFKDFDNVYIHPGIIPETFKGLEDIKIAVAHLDVDSFQSVKDCLEFVYPRMVSGGRVCIDDYNCRNCPGAKKAVDEFLKDKPEELIFPHEHNNPQVWFIKK